MRSMKYLLAVVLVFSLLLSACGGAGDDQGNGNLDNGALGTETLGNENGNLNGNTNDIESTGVATQGAGGPGLGTPAGTAEGTDTGALPTPLGTALGTAMATEPMATEPMATEAVTGTETPATGAEGTPVGTVTGDVLGTGTPAPGDIGDEQMFTNGILLSDLLGQAVVLDDGTASGAEAGGVQATVPAVDTGTGTPAAGTPAAGDTGNLGVMAGDDVGVVDSVVVSQENCRVLYVLVNSDLDGRLIPVPLSVFFSRGQTGSVDVPLRLNVDADVWNAAPGYEVDALPDLTGADWDVDLNTYWSGYTTGGVSSDGSAQTTGTGAVRVTDATDLNVTNANGEDLGDIEDFVISLNDQEISYAILAVGGILDLGEDLIPVPCERLTFQMDEGADTPTVILDVDTTVLEGAPTISEMPTIFDEGWDAEWQTYWDAQ